jgi:hypothetical protein
MNLSTSCFDSMKSIELRNQSVRIRFNMLLSAHVFVWRGLRNTIEEFFGGICVLLDVKSL